jgi:hypothetical protein
MPALPEDEFQRLLLNWRDRINPAMDGIRRAEDELLLGLTDSDQFQRATLFMTSVIGRREINMTSNTTNINAAGAVITGGTSHGNITGNLQQNSNPDVIKALADFDQLRQKLSASSALNDEEKQDTGAAIQDVRDELQKSPADRNPSRVRTAMKMLASSVKLVDGAQHIYDSIAPHVHDILQHLS